jgi:hypothetical protein
MGRNEALRLADEKGLDLVCVAPNAQIHSDSARKGYSIFRILS